MTYYPVANLGDGLAARTGGNGGEGVLWIHPYALDSSCWSDLWNLLPGWRHVAVDLPGHGLSLPLPPDADLAALARRLTAVAERQSLRHLVALSFGCIVALQTAIEATEEFASLVLGSPLVGEGANDEPFWKRYREMVNMYRMAGHGEFLRGRLMLVEPSPFEAAAGRPDLWPRLWETVGRHSFADLGDAALVRLGGFPQSDVRLHTISAAVLLVWGDEPRASRAYADRLERVIPDCRSLHLMGAGRLSLLERPEEAAAAIGAHLSRHPAPPSLGEGAA
jgi:pimeloyl-ACP methyl ester carboxylesterase